MCSFTDESCHWLVEKSISGPLHTQPIYPQIGLHLDECRVWRPDAAGLIESGAIQTIYPHERYERLDTYSGPCAPEISTFQQFLARVASQGAEVVAYGGDLQWFALRRRAIW
jgi:hypothetical protein